jgi:hypothetical protein
VQRYSLLGLLTSLSCDNWSLDALLWLSGSKNLSLETSLLSTDHNLESIQIGGLCSLGILGHLLVGSGGLPFVYEIETLGKLGKSAGSSTSKHWHSKSSKSKSLEWIDNSWEAHKTIN